MTARWDVQPRYRDSLTAHASHEAIAEMIKGAKAEHRRIGRHITWLEELHAKRLAEKESGAWPYRDDPDAVRFPCGQSHACWTCSPHPDVPGPGCLNCRDTGYDQTPCMGCAEHDRVGRWLATAEAQAPGAPNPPGLVRAHGKPPGCPDHGWLWLPNEDAPGVFRACAGNCGLIFNAGRVPATRPDGEWKCGCCAEKNRGGESE